MYEIGFFLLIWIYIKRSYLNISVKTAPQISMALPTLPSTYNTRRNVFEAAMIHRRTKDNDFFNKWNKTANYFQKENVEANKKAAWESNNHFSPGILYSFWSYRLKQGLKFKFIWQTVNFFAKYTNN